MKNLAITIISNSYAGTDEPGMETYPMTNVPVILQRIEELLGGKLLADSRARANHLLDGNIDKVFPKKSVPHQLRETIFQATTAKSVTCYLSTLGKPEK